MMCGVMKYRDSGEGRDLCVCVFYYFIREGLSWTQLTFSVRSTSTVANVQSINGINSLNGLIVFGPAGE